MVKISLCHTSLEALLFLTLKQALILQSISVIQNLVVPIGIIEPPGTSSSLVIKI